MVISNPTTDSEFSVEFSRPQWLN